jgi:hypothetical protein
MTFQTAMLASEAFSYIRQNVPAWKAQAQNANITLAAGNVDTNYVYTVLDGLRQIRDALAQWKIVTGLDTYAASVGYSGSMVADCTSTQTAAVNAITWVFQNFPTSGGFVTDNTLNADGSRTARSFTSAQTSGLQTLITVLIATIN